MKNSAIFFILLSSSVSAQTYQLGKQRIELPFEKSLLAKTSSPEENLVFFDANLPSPRPIFNAALSVFTYPDNVSSFEIQFRREKEAWLKKENSELIDQIKIESLPDQKAIISSFRFKHALGEFEEWSRFEQCPSGQAISLKWMIPETSFTSSPQQVESWRKLWKSKICPAKN